MVNTEEHEEDLQISVVSYQTTKDAFYAMAYDLPYFV